MRKKITAGLGLGVLFLCVYFAGAQDPASGSRTLILATTTSVQDTGLVGRADNCLPGGRGIFG